MSPTPSFGNPSGGESIDRAASVSIKLAHEALERFPEMVRRHKFIAGGAAISSSLIVLASVAIARRMLGGETAEEAVASVTEDEVQGLRVVEIPGDEDIVPEGETPVGEVDIEEAASNGEVEVKPSEPSVSRMNGAS